MTGALATAVGASVPPAAGSAPGAAPSKASAPAGLFAAALAALRVGARPEDDGAPAPSLVPSLAPPALPGPPAQPNDGRPHRDAPRSADADPAGPGVPGVDAALVALAVPLPATAPVAAAAATVVPAPSTPGNLSLGGGFPGPPSEHRLAAPFADAPPATSPAPGQGSGPGQVSVPGAALSLPRGPASAARAPLPISQPASQPASQPFPQPVATSPGVAQPPVPAAVVVRSEAPAPALPAPAPPGFASQLARPLFTVVAAGPGEHVMTVKVTPENLGPVTVQAHIGAEGVRVELFAPSDAGRAAVQAVLPELRRDLADAGLGASLDLSSRAAPQRSGGRGGYDDGHQGGRDGGRDGGGRGGRGGRAIPALRLEAARSARAAPLARPGADTSLDILA